MVDGLFVLFVVQVVAYVQTLDLLGRGEEAPAFSLYDMEGEQHSLESYGGKKTLLAFWAPWCSVCKVETGTLSSLQADLGEDVNVVSVVVGYEGKDEVRAFMEEHGVDYTVLLGNRSISKAYAVNKFPTLYVLDEKGRVQNTMEGYTSGVGLRWRLWF